MLKAKNFLFIFTFFIYYVAYSNDFKNFLQLSGSVYYGFQSKHTNLYWFATGIGVSSFDGQKFENYESKNEFFGLPCYKVIEDDYGRIWFYTSNGSLIVYNGFSFNQIYFSNDLYKIVVNGFICDFRIERNELILLVNGTLNSMSFNLISINLNNTNKYFTKLTPLKFTNKGGYLVAIYNKTPIVILDTNQSQFFYRVNGLEDYFFSKNKVIKYKSDKVNNLFSHIKSQINNVQFQNGKFIISTSNGTLIYLGETNAELVNNNLQTSSGFYDKEDNIFITTLNNGVIIKPRFTFQEILFNNINGLVKIKSINGKLYFVDKMFNLAYYDLEKKKSKTILFNTERNFSDANVFDYYGTFYFNKRKIDFKKSNIQIVKTTFSPFQVYKYLNFNYLISTGYADVKVMDTLGNKIKTIFYGKKVFDAKIDERGVLWVATTSGLYKGKINFMKGWEINGFDTLFKDKVVEQIEFYSGKVFVLVNRKSINIIDENSIQFNILKTTISNNKIISKYMFVDSNGLILCTNIGLCYVGFNIRNKLFEVDRSEFVTGFQGVTLNEIIDFDTLGDLVLFATSDKLFSINKDYWNKTNSFSKCYFESVYTGKRVFDIVDLRNNNKIELENDENTLDINIINSFFNKPSINELYKYFLIYNKDTLNLKYSNSNILKFYNLRFGSYKLVMQSRNNFNEWGELSILEFDIKPKFIETKLFFGIIVGVLVAILAIFLNLFFANKHKRIINNNLALESENYQLQLLKSQLNPHFLFNSLNSLKGLVYLDKKETALNYTDKLSSFLRSVLSSNQDLECHLKDELNVIEHYIEVERIRLGDRIFLELECEKGLLNLAIPSNILQPIVENSVKYGLNLDQEKLVVKVKCKRNMGELLLIIEDNGPGLKKEIDKKSFSLEAIKRRINKFNKEKIENCLSLSEIKLDDKVIGTQTIIKIRIYEDINR